MLQCDTSALRDEVGELESAVDDSLRFFHWVGLCEAFDSKGADIDEGESSFFFILCDVDAVGGDSLSHVLCILVYSVVEDSEVYFAHVNYEMSDQGVFA